MKSVWVLVPAIQQPRLSQALAPSTADDLEAWLQAAHHKGLAPSTINHLLSVLHRFCTVLQAQGQLVQPPIHWRRHQVLVPQARPRPMAEEDLIRFFQVMASRRARPMFLLMVRCGLRVGDVSALPWPAIHAKAGSSRIDNRKGQVDRVVYASPDVEQALRQGRCWQPPEATYVFARPLKHGLPLGVRALQRLMAKYLTRAQITTPYSPPSLRQSLCDPTAACGSPLRGGQRAQGPSLEQYDPALYPAL